VITWMLGHPWTTAGAFVLGLTAFSMLIALNPNGRQLRDLWKGRNR
jgi:hypothetical protein